MLYYPTAANTVQMTVQIDSDICTLENLFAVQVDGARTQYCHILPLALNKFIDYGSWILVACILTRPTGKSKYSTTRENIQ